MCVFCAAIPATLAIGASVSAKQLREQREAEVSGKAIVEKKQIPAGKIAFVAAGALAAASFVVHSQLNG